MECLQQNGDITGYIVRYSPLKQDLIPTDTVLVNVSADGDRELTLTGLLLLTPYQIEVAAFNDQGLGRFYNSRTGYLILENGTIGETTLNGSKFQQINRRVITLATLVGSLCLSGVNNITWCHCRLICNDCEENHMLYSMHA